MIRSTLAIGAGYISILALDSFVRIIIGAYHNGQIALGGISSLPSDEWGYLLVGLQFFWGLLAGLLVSSIARKQSHIETLSLILLLVGSGFIDYSMLQQSEPLWFFISTSLLRIVGILAGYYMHAHSTNSQPSIR